MPRAPSSIGPSALIADGCQAIDGVCLLPALRGHGSMSGLSPLSQAKRKSAFGAVRSANDDLKRAFGRPELNAGFSPYQALV
jgi:hypothetical protein